MSAHWTRKITFEADASDWVVLRDSLVVGRVMVDNQQSSRSFVSNGHGRSSRCPQRTAIRI